MAITNYSATTDYLFPSASYTSAQLEAWMDRATTIINEFLNIDSDLETNLSGNNTECKEVEIALVSAEWAKWRVINASFAQPNPQGINTFTIPEGMVLDDKLKRRLTRYKTLIVNLEVT